MNNVFISLGTNLGDRILNLNTAYADIEEYVGKIVRKSSFYKTPPWGFESEQDFVNSMILVQTTLNAYELLENLKKIEIRNGRLNKTAADGYQDRLIDLDIIDFNGDILESNNLSLPHPRLHLRNFVLVPLKEIDPNWVNPFSKVSVEELVNNVKNGSIIEKLY